MDEFAHGLDVLAEFLGDDHDLAMLRRRLLARRVLLQRPTELASLLEVLDLRRQELTGTAFDLAERLFEESPKEFAKKLFTNATLSTA